MLPVYLEHLGGGVHVVRRSAAGELEPGDVLVGPSSISAAENLASMLVQATDVITVGRRTAGTNGNITGIQLPAGFAPTFTGMQVLSPSGEDFMGRGILPDVTVDLTVEALASGRDPELEATVQALRQ